MSTELAQFDYDNLEVVPEVVDGLKDSANKIRSLVNQGVEVMLEIGMRLSTAQTLLKEDRQFSAWLNTEFGWSRTQAYNFINVYKRYKSVKNLNKYEKSALVVLSSPSVPDEAREEAAKVAEEEPVTHKKAAEIVEKHKPEPQQAYQPADAPDPNADNTRLAPEPGFNLEKAVGRIQNVVDNVVEDMKEKCHDDDLDYLGDRIMEIGEDVKYRS